MKALARWCFRHRKLVLVLWLIALVATFTASRVEGSEFSSKFSLPGTQSSTALELLQKDFPTVSGDTDQIVLHTRTGTVRAPAVKAEVERMLREVAALPHVTAVASPYTAPGGAQISRDGTIAFATVNFDQVATSLSLDTINRVVHTAQAAQTPVLQVALGGMAIETAEMPSFGASTIVGIVLALVVLGLAFGALFAAFLPLITALIAIAIGSSVTGLLTHAFSVASFSTVLGVLIGLGVVLSRGR